ncbi:hypothetical protein [Lonepinella koalarum]|uniref:Beta-barrel assembly machine subunit BamE n=1 Tax=Lonepinella koalarum TaxID=53417 RepID=A0A4V2PUF4_9PAST|nr:hypothetical protein [Lonepinella koalarum]TCK70351.1 hypothetical protein EV692_0617 [Lonepinella koalarum]
MLKKWMITVIFCFLVGCANKPSYNQLAMNLQMGMTKQEVINLLGEPKKVFARSTNKGQVEVLSYWGLVLVGFNVVDNQMLSQDRLSVTLLNNKVTEWGDKLDSGEMLDKTQERTLEYIDKIQSNTKK